MLLYDAEDFKSELLVKCHIFRVMCYQRNHQLVPIGIMDSFFYQCSCNSMMLHVRIYCQIDDVDPLLLMQLIGPAGVQIIPSKDKIKKGFQRVVFLDEIAVCTERSLH